MLLQKLIFIFVFFCYLFLFCYAEIGAFDAMAKSAIEGAKDFMERILLQVRIPKIVQNPSGPGISFQLDDASEANAPIPECKECILHSSEALVGAWQIALWSHNFLITVISDLNMQIDKLAANQPIKDQKSLYEWLADPPRILCPQLVVLSKSEATKFEFAYTIDPGLKPKSIINKWDRQFDGSILWHLTPLLKVHICPVFVQKDVIILRQIDSFPRCTNLIVLIRGEKNYGKVDAIRDMLESEESTKNLFGTNSFVRPRCNF